MNCLCNYRRRFFAASRYRHEYLLVGTFCLLTAIISLCDYHSWTTPYTAAGELIEAIDYLASDLALFAFLYVLLGRRFLRLYVALAVLDTLFHAWNPLWAANLLPTVAFEFWAPGYLMISAGLLALLTYACRRGSPSLRRDVLPIFVGIGLKTFSYLPGALPYAARYGLRVPVVLSQPRLHFGPFMFNSGDFAK